LVVRDRCRLPHRSGSAAAAGPCLPAYEAP